MFDPDRSICTKEELDEWEANKKRIEEQNRRASQKLKRRSTREELENDEEKKALEKEKRDKNEAKKKEMRADQSQDLGLDRVLVKEGSIFFLGTTLFYAIKISKVS